MVLDNVSWTMFHTPVSLAPAIVMATLVLLCYGDIGTDLKTATACYGNTNNNLRLTCDPGELIHVLRVIHSAKIKEAECIGPANVLSYRKECCRIQPTDCDLVVRDASSIQCENQPSCAPVATWSITSSDCDQDLYPSTTNYMRMEYMCVRDSTSLGTTTKETSPSTSPTTSTPPSGTTTSLTSASTNRTSSPLAGTHPDTRPATTLNIPTFTPTTPGRTSDYPNTSIYISTSRSIPTTHPPNGITTLSPISTNPNSSSANLLSTAAHVPSKNSSQLVDTTHTTTPPSTTSGYPTTSPVASVPVASVMSGGSTQKSGSDDEMSDAMIGAIVGGCLGMVLTFVIFVFYWGRKRHLRIVGKPQPTVWDYLLSNTFTVRGNKGYDHFSSIRSSASSDGDPNSPVVRKNIWLPNIVDKDERTPHDDAISNYDNENDRYHRVEIHHNAIPSPYAILNLHVNNLHPDSHQDV